MTAGAGPAGGAGARVGTRVTHRCYVLAGHAHYGGQLIDSAYSLVLFGDVATELCVRTDGDERLSPLRQSTSTRRYGPATCSR